MTSESFVGGGWFHDQFILWLGNDGSPKRERVATTPETSELSRVV